MLQVPRGWSSDMVWVGEGEGATGIALVFQKSRRLAVSGTSQELRDRFRAPTHCLAPNG